MKSFTLSTALFFSFLLLSLSCKTAYVASDFDSASADHIQIAVIPIEMKYTGKVQKDMDETMMAKQAVEESELFQQAMTNEILSNARNRTLRVKIIPASTVNGLLTKAGLDVQSSWSTNPKELAKILGVDAVVSGHIVKDQRFSDGVSVGADVATSVITENAGTLLGRAGSVLQNNKRVYANYKLVDGDTGSILWSSDCNVTFDWKTEHHQVIRNTTDRIARTFPYREKKK